MSVTGSSIEITRTKLLVALVLAVAIGGSGVGLVSTGVFEAADSAAPSPPGAGSTGTELATIDVTAADPPNVRSGTGEAGIVAGAIDGRLRLYRDVDRVELLVRSRLPNGTWVVIDRTALGAVPAGAVDLASATGGETQYLDATQSDGFDVTTPGTTARRSGFVSVTARLYADGARVGTVTDTDGYAFLVDRPAARTVGGAGTDSAPREQTDADATPTAQSRDGRDDAGRDGDGADESDDDSETRSRSDLNRTTALLGARNVVPGSSGQSAAAVSNPSDERVTATFRVGAPIDAENGLTEPESAVDDTPDRGELAAHLDVRIAIVRADGGGSYLAGGESEYVSLSDAATATQSLELDPNETVTVVVEWRVDRAVGNEIQSDGTSLSVHTTFEPTSTLLESTAGRPPLTTG
ncbi:hypothetical protein DVK02_12285 [Halobellus sp. Atlit-31R]|nr:hypothetical protein DVK02_12285 [Halobellus sp. Atlit-31R]